MRHKNIAVLMTALDTDGQADMLKGIEKFGKEHGCNIAVFLWFTGAFERDKHNQGELNIINLPDFNLFDGVILFSNTLHMENNRKKIEALLEGIICPVVCIGCKVKDYVHIASDNYTAMRKLVEHYVHDHKMQRIHFVKGVEGNEDAQARFQAYVDVLTENHIPVIPERISQGDFYVTGAARAAKEILNSSLPFPEAIVCANDVMAVTICDILTEKGYRIPEDVVVSGYDYALEGQNHFPRLTTVRTRFKEIGVEACKTLLAIVAGQETEKEIYLPDEVVLEESCGHIQSETDEELRKRMASGAYMVQRKLIHQLIVLEKSIIEGKDFSDWRMSMKDFISQINPPEFYLCVNQNFVKDIFEQGMMEQEEMSEEERLAYSEEVEVPMAYRSGLFLNKQPFESRYAFDELFQDAEKGKLYIFSPMHYLDRNFGYFVFVDSSFPVANQLYVSWLINIGDSIENIRKQNLLKNAMSRLDEMYIKDSLTGAYNRFGMERFFAEIKRKCMLSRIPMQVSFVDIDGLKRINDEFGHEEGDRIINAAAEILQKKAGKNYVIRYGGDEFIVMGAVRSEKEIQEYWQSVMEEVKLYNEAMNRPAKVSFSYGYDVFKVDANMYLEECIRISDKKMYVDKMKKRS